MAAILGVGGLLGALVAARLAPLVSPYASIITVFWGLAALTPVAAVLYSGYLLGVLFAAMAILPATAATTTGALLLTSDEMRGRLSSVLSILGGGAAVAGPVAGGLLVSVLSGSIAVLLCAVGIAATAVVATFSPTLRSFPRPPRGADHQQVPQKGE